jgi:hypothetical protein
LETYHHGTNEGLTSDIEGARLLGKDRRDGEPEGNQQGRKEHEEEETSLKRE